MQPHSQNISKQNVPMSDYRNGMPIFDRSGLLEKDKIADKIEIKHSPPVDSISPITFFENHCIEPHQRPLLKAKLYRKGYAGIIGEIDLERKDSFLIGRMSEVNNNQLQKNSIVDICIPDSGCSKQHCVIQFREIKGQLVPYVMDLDSVNGTSLNGILLPPKRYVRLSSNDILTFSRDDVGSEFEIIFQSG
ncbi:pre-mRNA leakage protein 1 [Monosporozyma servazzii]